MKNLFFIILFSANYFAQSNIPQIGDPLPCITIDSVQWLISSGQLARGCYKIFDNVKFFFASTDENNISFIATSDSSFVTPEGFKVGDSFNKIISKVETNILTEKGWGYYSKLPSGWFANYYLDEAAASHHFIIINSDSTVFQFFQRR